MMTRCSNSPSRPRADNFAPLRFFLPSLLLLCSVLGLSAESRFLRHTVPAVDLGSSAVAVLDLRTGKYVDTLNITRPLVPASIMKCVTTASLLKEAGPDLRLQTKVYTRGKVDGDGVLDGGLLIVGSGDPTVNANCEPPSNDFVEEIVAALLKKKVSRLRGPVEFDESAFEGPAVPPSWAKGDLNESYGTGFHGFNFERNASCKRAVSDPAATFRTRLVAALGRAGIEYEPAGSGAGKGHRKLLLEHESAPLSDIMRSCMMRSDNLFAESLLRILAVRKGNPGSTVDAVGIEEKMWNRKRLPSEGVRIVDGSGLSRSNRMTADFMARLLQSMRGDEIYASLFPLVGREGTVRKFLAGTELDSYMVLKTGSMNGIQCYAGYKVDDDYRPTHAVVVILNNMRDRASARKAVADYLLDLFVEPAETDSVTEGDRKE